MDPRLHNFENFWKSCHTTTPSTPPSSALSDDSPATSTMSAFFQSDNNINKSNSYSDTDNDPYAEKQKNDRRHENINKNENSDKNEMNNNNNNNEVIINKKEKRENPFRERKEIFRDLYEDGSDDIGLNDEHTERSIRKDESDDKGGKDEKEEAVGTERAWSKIGARNKERGPMEKAKNDSESNDTEADREIVKEREKVREIDIEQEKEKEGKEKAALPRTGSSAEDLTRHNPFRKNGK